MRHRLGGWTSLSVAMGTNRDNPRFKALK